MWLADFQISLKCGNSSKKALNIIYLIADHFHCLERKRYGSTFAKLINGEPEFLLTNFIFWTNSFDQLGVLIV